MMFRNTRYAIHTDKDFDYVLVEGKTTGCVPLVLLHGMFGGLSNFDIFIQRMNGERTIVVPQIPLYDINNNAISIPKLADWLRNRIKKQLGFNQVILLGNSLGGHIALECVVRDIAWVKGLILTGSSGMSERGFGYSRPRRFDREYIRERASMTFYNNIVDEVMIDEIQSVLRNNNKLSRLLNIARSARRFNMGHKLKRINQPTLLIWGENDKITPPEAAALFKEKLPNASLQWIAECGHAPMMEKPEEFTRCVRLFLNSIDHPYETETITKLYKHEKSYT